MLDSVASWPYPADSAVLFTCIKTAHHFLASWCLHAGAWCAYLRGGSLSIFDVLFRCIRCNIHNLFSADEPQIPVNVRVRFNCDNNMRCKINFLDLYLLFQDRTESVVCLIKYHISGIDIT